MMSACAVFLDRRATTADAFYSRFAGGYKLYSDAGATSGAELAAGSGAWSSLSDVNVRATILQAAPFCCSLTNTVLCCAVPCVQSKRDFAAVNGSALLDGIASLPIQSWRYKTQPERVRHIGPTAQDFHRVFGGYGESSTRISTVDVSHPPDAQTERQLAAYHLTRY